MGSFEDEFRNRAEITDLVHRYAQSNDACDADAVAECFVEDSVVEYEGGSIRLDGREALRRFLKQIPPGPSTHLMSNILTELIGAEAHVQSAAIVCVTRHAGLVTVRGVGYEFRCIRENHAWRLKHLRHEARWEFAVPGGAPSTASR